MLIAPGQANLPDERLNYSPVRLSFPVYTLRFGVLLALYSV